MQHVEMTDTSLASRLTELVRSGEVQLPALPEVAVKAREMLSSDALNMRELGEVLTGDPAIAAALLRLANSAHFGGLGRVNTVATAVQRIGLTEVGAIVTGLSLKALFDHPSPEKRELLQVLWDHSVTTAFAARRIASEIGVDGEQAFLGGLLHDCGKVIVLAALDRLESEKMEVRPTREVVVELMDELHMELGHHLLETWNIEVEIADVARRHESHDEEAGDLLLAVQAANLITRKLGFHLHPDPELLLTEHVVMEDLGLDDLTLATLMIDMEDHLEEMKRLF